MAVSVSAALGSITVTGLRTSLFPPYIDVQSAGAIAVTGLRPDVYQISAVVPGDSDTGVAPGRTISFTLLNSALTYVEMFDSTLPDEWELCTPANGYTATEWGGAADNWSLVQEDGEWVLKASGKAHAVWKDNWRDFMEMGAVTAICRVRWYTGAQAGLNIKCRIDSYGKATKGLYNSMGAEIDSGGLRLIRYDGTPSRIVRATSSFTPTNGAWYWVQLQVKNNTGTYRARYWTGEREDIPSGGWTAWVNDTMDGRSGRFKNVCVRSHTGTAAFNDVEIQGMPDRDELDKMVVDVNGDEYKYSTGNVTIGHRGGYETLDTDSVAQPVAQDWLVTVNAQESYDPDDRDQNITVKWERPVDTLTIETFDFDTANFPHYWPTYDPSTDNASADPSRMTNFDVGAGAIDALPVGWEFYYLATLFLSSQGNQIIRYNIAPNFWITNYEDFEFVIAAYLYGNIDGQYVIGHPVWREHKASLIPAELVFEDHKGEVIVKGSLQERFTASVVPQAYIRADHKASVLPSAILWWEGDASALVGEEILVELDASGLVFMRREGSVVHLRVVSDATHAQLMAMGVQFTAPLLANTPTVTLTGLPATVVDQSDIFATLATVAVSAFDLAWGIDVEASSTGAVTCSALSAQIVSAQIAYTGLGTVIVTGYDTKINWYDTAWSYRVPLWVKSDQVDASATLDVLLMGDNMPSEFWTNVDVDGDDIVITEADGRTKANRDLIKWNRSGEVMQVRFSGTISSSADTLFYLYYGNSGASESTRDTTTYPSGLTLVLPLEEDPGTTTPVDATGTHSPTKSGTWTAGDLLAGGIDNGWDFDSAQSDYLTVPDHSELDLPSAFSLSTFFRVDNAGNVSALFSRYDNQNTKRSYWVTWDGGNNRFACFVSSDGGTNYCSYYFTDSLTNSQLYHLFVVYDKDASATNRWRLWIDGVELSETVSSDNSYTPFATDVPLHIGAQNLSGSMSYFIDGLMDESRVYRAALTANEVSTRYNNEIAPNDFVTAGPQQDTVTWYNSAWKKRFGLHVQPSKIAGALSNFDLLITEANVPSEFWDTVDSSGDDVVVCDSNGSTKLDRDLIDIDTTAETIQMRVKLASLAVTGRTLWIYYDNSGASETARDTTVYPSGLTLALPFEENPGTSNPTDATGTHSPTKSGTWIAGDEVAAGINNGWDFDSAQSDYVNVPDHADLDLPGQFTFSFYFRTDANNALQAVASRWETSGNKRTWRIDYDGANSRWQCWIDSLGTGASYCRYYFNHTPTNGTWYHVVARYDKDASATNRWKMWIDGVSLSYSGNGGDGSITPFATDTQAWIGSERGTTNYLDGALDELRIYRSTLTDNEITTRMANEVSPETFYACTEEETY